MLLRSAKNLDALFYFQRLICILTIFVFTISSFGQEGLSLDSSGSITVLQKDHRENKSRVLLITGVNVAGYGGSLLILNNTWYKNYPRSGFHTFNDSKEWLQMDKIGHGWTAYNTGMATTAMWEWAGLKHEKAVWIGGLSGAVFLTVIEILDAHSERWGWSWADIGANVLGSGMFMAQELTWKEQRIQFKFSFHRHSYPDEMTRDRANDLFGNSWAERMLKDYNGQTYWLSLNLKSVFRNSALPRWLNVAVGYGADGLLGGFENKWTESGNEFTRYDISRKRQFYISPDIDFTKIHSKTKFGKAVLGLLNILKFPAPALMLDNKGKMRVYALYF